MSAAAPGHAAAGGAASVRGALAAVVASALFAGCATVPDDAPPPVSGRLSVQVAGADGAPARGFNAAFDLRGDADRGRLDLSTPLGPQIAVARWAPGEVVLESSEGTQRFASLAALSRELLGEDLPLQALPDWLQGRPWSGAAHAMADAGFDQLGWRLDLSRRDTGFVTATRAAPPVVTLRVRLAEPPR